MLYTGGFLVHIVKLIVRFSWRDMPFFVDWVIIVLGAIGVFAYMHYFRSIEYRGTWEIVVHWVMVGHISISIILHGWALAIGSHRIFGIFPYGYSYFALGYFGFFAWRAWSIRFVESAAR